MYVHGCSRPHDVTTLLVDNGGNDVVDKSTGGLSVSRGVLSDKLKKRKKSNRSAIIMCFHLTLLGNSILYFIEVFPNFKVFIMCGLAV